MENKELYRVPEQNLSKLQARIAKLAKRAIRLHVDAPSIEVVSTDTVKVVVDGFERTRNYHNVRVVGVAPKIAGWTFAAVLQASWTEDGTFIGNILRKVPGFSGEILDRYRAATSVCEHCNTSRRRNETFVLVNESNEWKQVGRQCLRDFLGHMSPEAYASMAEILIDAADLAEASERDEFGGSGYVERFTAEEVLTIGACAIRLYGFVSNKVAQDYGKQSTSGLVNEWILSNAKQREKFEHPLVSNEDDAKQAADVYEWLQSLSSRENLTDYFYNLSLLGQGATFTSRNFGLAISAIAMWAKEMEREINRKKRFAEDASSQYVGEIKKRSTFEALTLVYTRDFESDYGVSHFYKFKDAAGNLLVWFSSNVLHIDGKAIEIGNTVTLVASVKAHEEYKGVKQTVITRAALPAPPKPPQSKEEKKARKALRMAQHIRFRVNDSGDAYEIMIGIENQMEQELKVLVP